MPCSSDEVTHFARGRFAPHGAMQVEQHGSVLVGHCYGPFNLEFVQAYGRMWAAHFAGWTGAPALILLTVWHDSAMATPEAIGCFRELMALAARTLPADTLHLWLMPEDLEGASLTLPSWTAAMTDNGLAVEVLRNEAAVQQRIDQHLGR
ncbi:hypothetical protein RQP53_14240 [Paucibacter sp. APW11]|uniref:Uncharacterized protein n=1 Tax=Roseateles aquae TaxID=3077235 RepID=A0ABU3PCW6_9BURK|nr:hypothetical protein [Paucibacter sp. APW11]MDT9000431.1 hypothetical protein [Paucibacter sp. APW11]